MDARPLLNQKKPSPKGETSGKGLDLECVKRSKVLYLDLHFHTTGQLKLHESIHSLGSRAVDVDEALVS